MACTIYDCLLSFCMAPGRHSTCPPPPPPNKSRVAPASCLISNVPDWFRSVPPIIILQVELLARALAQCVRHNCPVQLTRAQPTAHMQLTF